MLHAFRRGAVALALAVPLLGLAPGAAHADTCTGDPLGPGLPPGPITIPCPGPQDVLVAPLVWYTTASGPGVNDEWFNYIVIQEGGRIVFTNGSKPWRLYGDGFDSGWVPPFMTVDISGVSALSVGTYTIYVQGGYPTGTLYIRERPKVCVECVT